MVNSSASAEPPAFTNDSNPTGSPFWFARIALWEKPAQPRQSQQQTAGYEDKTTPVT